MRIISFFRLLGALAPMAGFHPEKSLRVYGGGPARESHPVVYHPRSAAEPTGHLKLYSFTVLYYSAWVLSSREEGTTATIY